MASNERRVAVDTARAAGQLLHREHPAARQVSYKGAVTNLVTEMDGRAEALIVHALLEAFPDDGILGEEGSARAGSSGRRWILDPLDGTTNYAHGLPIYSVGIGLEQDGRIVLGVVYDPSRDELFTAERGGGAWLNERRLAISSTATLDTSLLVTGLANGEPHTFTVTAHTAFGDSPPSDPSASVTPVTSSGGGGGGGGGGGW